MKLFKGMNSKNTALLVIDIVNYCAHEKYERKGWGMTYRKIRKMVDRLDKFIRRFKEEIDGKVIYANITPWQKQYLPENIRNMYEYPEVCFYSQDKTGKAEAFYKLKPEKNDLVINKNTYDAYSNKK